VKLHATAPTAPTARNGFTGYGEGYVLVNGARHESSVIVTPEQVLPWQAAGFDALAAGDFEVIAGLDLEILLIGTGSKQRFPHPRLTRALAEKRVGIEAMDLQAACRTYNILMTEGRRIAAALLFK
jgi:uncharacterized protein